jgi:hypothetical protein
MLRSLLALLPILFVSNVPAQKDPALTPSDSLHEPKHHGQTEVPTVNSTDVKVTGAFDVAPAPPACAESEGQARLNCISDEVLAATRKGSDPSADRSGPHSYPVLITFVINQYGEMKDIRVEHTGASELPKKVIVALYALPKFIAARKDGKAVGATVSITYPFEALFSTE